MGASLPKAKITKRAVEALQPGQSDIILWDTELKGFGCKVTPKGKKAYFLYYRTSAGSQRRPFIGPHGALTAEQARDIARQWLAQAANGEDPGQRRKTLKEGPTIADLCTRFLKEHVATRRKAKTAYDYERLIQRFVLPNLGGRKVIEVTRGDVANLHFHLRETPYQANRVLAVISKIMNLAERWGLRPDGSNPCRHIEKFREIARQRYLSAVEMKRLALILAKLTNERTESPQAISAIRLLMFTGCRVSEILTLRWEWIDLSNRCLRLPDSKTGTRHIQLNSLALQELSLIERIPNNAFVITGSKTGCNLVNLEKPWRRIRAQAGLSDLRLHDLRHTFASIGAGLGQGLPIIGKLLGHSQAQTTHRYAHLDADPVASATEQIANVLKDSFQ